MKNRFGDQPLAYAIKKNDFNSLDELIKNGAILNL